MNFKMPTKMPLKHTFADFMFECMLGAKDRGTGTVYKNLFTNFYGSFSYDYNLKPSDDLVRYAKEVDFYVKRIYGKAAKADYSFYSGLAGSVKGLTDTKTIGNWLSTTTDSHFTRTEDICLSLPYFVFKGPASDDKKVEFFKYCLETLGVSSISERISEMLFKFDWSEGVPEELKEGAEKIEVIKLTNRGIIACGIAAAVIIRSIGYKVDENVINKFHSVINELFAGELKAEKAINFTQKTLFDCVKYFEPRSIACTELLYPENYYIPSLFKDATGADASPVAGVDGDKSWRSLIVAKTGFGKTAFMQMFTMCTICNSIDENMLTDTDRERLKDIKEMGKRIGAPDDKVVISIPAKMFSFLYFSNHSSVDNLDFVEMFIYCMWNLHGKYNFYSKDYENPRFKAETPFKDFVYDKNVKKAIASLAKKGKLILLLDSFDEITHGDMRTKYLAAISKFHDEYCCHTEADTVGAHIVMTSREMSPDTMTSIQIRLGVDAPERKFSVLPLSNEGKFEIIRRWRKSDTEADEMMNLIKKNHFYEEYSVNPYMLSVVCDCMGERLGYITRKLIETLVRRMRENNRNADLTIQGVFSHITEILQEVAIETILDNNAHFSKDLLASKIATRIDLDEISSREAEHFLDTLHSIFVTEVGLIVPADGEDGAYQFINDQIRYELASEGFKRYIYGDLEGYRVLSCRVPDVAGYTGLLIPVLCSLDVSQPEVSEGLIKDLIMRDYETEDEGRMLVEAMLDLVLSRYGSSIATVLKLGDKDKAVMLKAQRLLMMRILCSACFEPKDYEKKEILQSAAYKNSESWLSDTLKEALKS